MTTTKKATTKATATKKAATTPKATVSRETPKTLTLDVFGQEISKRCIAKDSYLDYINLKQADTKVAEIWVRRTGYQVCTKTKLTTKIGDYVLKDKWQVPHTYNNLNQSQVEELIKLVMTTNAPTKAEPAKPATTPKAKAHAKKPATK